jgi:hypothetical protein
MAAEGGHDDGVEYAAFGVPGGAEGAYIIGGGGVDADDDTARISQEAVVGSEPLDAAGTGSVEV